MSLNTIVDGMSATTTRPAGFTYRALPWNLRFELGAFAQLAKEVDGLGYRRALILATPHQAGLAQSALQNLGPAAVGIFDQARIHVPTETVEEAAVLADRLDADCSIAIGGGSTTGLGKALALRYGLRNVAVPTSYAGSEMTNIWGITDAGKKITGRDNTVVPDLVIYDPELTLSLKPDFAAASGMNALAQAAVNVATDSFNPIVSSMSLQAVELLATALPALIDRPRDLELRSEMMLGACLAGAALGTGKTGLHHKLCHVLGGMLNTPHAQTHAILLPHSVAYNAAAIPNATHRLAKVLGVDNAALGLFELARSIDIPTGLSAIGVIKKDLERVASLTASSDFSNPAPIIRDRILELLINAFHGYPPTANGG